MPGQVDEQAPLDVPDVDHALPPAERDGERRGRVPGDAELAGETVAGAGRHDAERGAAPRHGARDLVHRPVAAPGADDGGAGSHRRTGELECVARPLGELHRPLDASRGERALGESLPAVPGPAASQAGGRIDDDGDRRGQMRSKPRISSQSVTTWSNVCCSSRAVWR